MATSTREKDKICEPEKIKSKISIYQEAIYSRYEKWPVLKGGLS
jgi:hypothetical protein